MYALGLGVPKDWNAAFKLYRQAADASNPGALFGLGWLYEKGNGVAKDEKQSQLYYRKSAELGYVDAMTNLANMLVSGRGSRVDAEEAATWVYRALQAGDAHEREEMRNHSSAWGLPFRKALQRKLKEGGVYSGPADGKFGATTFAAIDALASK